MKSSAIDPSLRANFAWVLSGNVVYSACQWGFLVAFAKLGSATSVGEYALGLAIASPIVLFANLQLRALLASDVREEFRFGEYLGFRVTTLAAAIVIVAGIALKTSPDWRIFGVVVLIGFGLALEYLSDTYYGFMQQHDRMDRISRSLIIKGPLSLVAVCVVMYLTKSFLWAIVALISARLIVLLCYDSRIGFAHADKQAVRLRVDRRKTWTLFQMALPLGILSMLGSLNSNVPRYFLEGHLGTTELGIYSAVASLLTAGSLVVSAYGQSSYLGVAQACASGNRSRFRQYIAIAAALGAALGCVAVLISALFGRQILTHLFRPEYGDHADVLVRLMFAGTITFIASGLGYVMTAARSLRPQIPLLIATAATSALVSAWAVPRFGLQGAVTAAIAAATVQLIGEAVILWTIDRRLGRHIEVAVPQKNDIDSNESLEMTT